MALAAASAPITPNRDMAQVITKVIATTAAVVTLEAMAVTLEVTAAAAAAEHMAVATADTAIHLELHTATFPAALMITLRLPAPHPSTLDLLAIPACSAAL